MHQLNNLVIASSENSLSPLVITDASIKCDMAMSIAHVHIHNKPVVKTLYHVVNVTSIEAELFTMRYGINQATSFQGISKIIIVTDSIHLAKRIFDLSLHPFQIHVTVRCSSHWGGSLQNGLRDEQTCGMTLASAYVLHHLSAVWLQLQIMGRSLR